MNIKKILIVLILILLNIKNVYAENISTNLKVGDVINFGKYNIDSPDEKSDIEWVVLDVKEDRALIFSKYILTTMVYSIIGNNYYIHSSIRKYLNEEFIESFNGVEKQIILETINENNKTSNESSTYNTKDLIFILSSYEIEEYFGRESSIKSEIYGIGSALAKSNGLLEIPCDDLGVKTSPYWLRDDGFEENYAKAVSYNGKILEDGYFYHRYNVGVRPALWIKIDKN